MAREVHAILGGSKSRAYYPWVDLDRLRMRMRLSRSGLALALGYHPCSFSGWRRSPRGVPLRVYVAAKMLSKLDIAFAPQRLIVSMAQYKFIRIPRGGQRHYRTAPTAVARKRVVKAARAFATRHRWRIAVRRTPRGVIIMRLR